MLLRFLFSILLLTFIHSQCNAVGSHPATSSSSIISNQNTPQKKQGFFKKLQHSILSKKVEKFLKKYESQRCDIVVLNNGDQFDVKVIDITEDAVLYRDCKDDSGEATDQFEAKEVSAVKFANGEFFVLRAEKLVKSEYKEPLTKGGFLLGFVLGFIFNIFGLIFILIAFHGKRRTNALLGALTGILALILFLIWSILSAF